VNQFHDAKSQCFIIATVWFKVSQIWRKFCVVVYVNLLSPPIKQITFSRNFVANCIDVVLTKVTRNKEKLWNRSYYKTLWFSVMKLIHTFGWDMLRINYVNKSLQYSDCVYSMLNVPFEVKSLDCVLICYAELRTLNIYLFMDVNIYFKVSQIWRKFCVVVYVNLLSPSIKQIIFSEILVT
jgi:hypothetical protein